MKKTAESSAINRRKFFSTGGAGLIAASLPVFARSEPATRPITDAPAPIKQNGWKDMLQEALKYRKLDAHNHVFDDGATVNESCRRVGIDRAACSIPGGKTMQAIRDNNDIVLKAMKSYPKRILGQCYINPSFQKESLEEIDRC